MPGPDLTLAALTVTGLMDDTCLVTRPSHATELNTRTGRLDPVGSAPVVYQGPCLFRELTRDDIRMLNQPKHRRLFRISIPLSAPMISIGDEFTVLACLRTPDFAGLSFRIANTIQKTFAVSRSAIGEILEAVRDRP